MLTIREGSTGLTSLIQENLVKAPLAWLASSAHSYMEEVPLSMSQDKLLFEGHLKGYPR